MCRWRWGAGPGFLCLSSGLFCTTTSSSSRPIIHRPQTELTCPIFCHGYVSLIRPIRTHSKPSLRLLLRLGAFGRCRGFLCRHRVRWGWWDARVRCGALCFCCSTVLGGEAEDGLQVGLNVLCRGLCAFHKAFLFYLEKVGGVLTARRDPVTK